MVGYDILGYFMLWNIVLCYVMLWNIMLCYVVLCCILITDYNTKNIVKYQNLLH